MKLSKQVLNRRVVQRELEPLKKWVEDYGLDFASLNAVSRRLDWKSAWQAATAHQNKEIAEIKMHIENALLYLPMKSDDALTKEVQFNEGENSWEIISELSDETIAVQTLAQALDKVILMQDKGLEYGPGLPLIS